MRIIIYFLLTALLPLHIKVYAQEQNACELFSVNGKYGLVSTADLSEMQSPVYSKAYPYFAKDYFGLGRDTVVLFFHKQTGKQKKYTLADKDLIWNSEGNYLHIYQEGKSALLTEALTIKALLPRKYTALQKLYSSNYLVAKYNKGYDVINIQQPKKPVHSGIAANNYVFGQWKDHKGQIVKRHTFYGMAAIWLFDQDWKLLQKIPKNAPDFKALQSVLELEWVPEEYDEVRANDEGGWRIATQKNGNNYYEAQAYNDVFLRLRKEFMVKQDYSSDRAIVYQYEDKRQTFEFKIYKDTVRAILPLQYQQQMGLAFVPKDTVR